MSQKNHINKQPGMMPERFDEHYEGGSLWDIGRPQDRLVEQFSHDLPQSPVLDIGCGTGDTAIYLAEKGCNVSGVDFSPKAIEIAREKASARGLDINFMVQDVFQLDALGMRFNSVIDCLFFHLLDNESRCLYESMLSRIVNPLGKVYMLNLSDELPFDDSPRAIREDDIRDSFSGQWSIVSLENTRVGLPFLDGGWYGTYAVLQRKA